MSNIKELLYQMEEEHQARIIKAEQEYAKDIIETALTALNMVINPDSFEFRVDDGVAVAERVDGYGPSGRGMINSVTVKISFGEIIVTVSYWGDGEEDEEETFYI